MSLVAWLVVSLVMVVIQGLLLQTACVAAGERSPRFVTALFTGLMGASLGSITVFAFGWTVGLLVHLFVGRTFAWIAGIGLGFLVTSTVYKLRLRLPVGASLKIAALHLAATWLIDGLVWGVVKHGLF
ncbi:MAG: hypothetical protein R3F59_28740 [Myxococcota bacterium]